MTKKTIAASPWAVLGYHQDVYFIEPLAPDEKGARLLAGRESEAADFLQDVLSGTRALKFVTGDAGVGKTSFVNICQHYSQSGEFPEYYRFAGRRLLIAATRLQCEAGMSVSEFSEKAVHILARNVQRYFDEAESKPDSRLQDHVAYWCGTRMLASRGGVSFGGFGLEGPSYERSGRVDPAQSFQEMISILRNEYGLGGVFMVVDNLELIGASGLVKILDGVRDSLLGFEGAYWILIGPVGTLRSVSERSRRITSYVSGPELRIAPLSEPMLSLAVARRCEAFRMTTRYHEAALQAHGAAKIKYTLKVLRDEAPLTKASLRLIYEMTHGEMRETFRLASTVTRLALSEIIARGPLLPENTIEYLLELIQSETHDVVLTARQRDLLIRAYPEPMFTIEDFHNFGYKNAAGFAAAVSALVSKGLLIPDTTTRRSSFRSSWRLEALALSGELNSDTEELALDRLSKAAAGDFN